MKKLRLLLFEKCNRNCPGCCNNDWDLKSLPVLTIVHDVKKYDEVLLTGGEPMLEPLTVINTILSIRRYNRKCKIFLYTAKVDNIEDVKAVMNHVDGLTITLHEQKDIGPFLLLNSFLLMAGVKRHEKSFRLNIFKSVDVEDGIDFSLWKIKYTEWIKNCPLPKGEVFYRL